MNTGTYLAEAPGVVRGYLLPLRSLEDIGSQSKIAPIYFQTMPTVSESKTATYNSETIPGRSDPYSIFSAGGVRSFTLGLTYAAINERFDIQWTHQMISRLQALCYPIYTRKKGLGQSFVPPPLVLLNLGYRFVNIPCVVTQYGIETSDDDAMEVYTMLPLIVKISITLQTSYPYGFAPGHDDIASKFIGEPGYETAGMGDSIMPDFATPNYDSLSTSMPINVWQDGKATASYERSLEIRSAQSAAVASIPLSQVAFNYKDLA